VSEVDIILPVLDAAKFVRECVAALFEHTPPVYHLYVADDGSREKELLAFYGTLEGLPNVTIRRNEERQGFPKNCNSAVTLGSSPIILLLNSDTVPQPNWLEYILEEFENNPKAGVVGARLLYPAARLGHKAGTIQHAGVAFNEDGLPYHIYIGRSADDPRVNKRRAINAVTGACLATRRALWEKIGGFDERYAYGQFEDIDYCLEVRRRGWQVVYRSKSVLYHYEHGSGEKYVNQTTTRNRQRLVSKWGRIPSDEDLFL
jgi:GT2 family glycosyltransferase